MCDPSHVDVELDRARTAYDACIDDVLAAVHRALGGIRAQVERLEALRGELGAERARVADEIDALTDRAVQLEALTLPGPLAEGMVYDGEDVDVTDRDVEEIPLGRA